MGRGILKTFQRFAQTYVTRAVNPLYFERYPVQFKTVKIEMLVSCSITVEDMLLSELHVNLVGWFSSCLIGQWMYAFHFLNVYSHII